MWRFLLLFIFKLKKSTSENSTRPIPKKDQKAVVIAYQTGIDPSKVAQANGDYEKDSQQKIEWKKFDTGADVVNALASGDVSIGNIGTSPLATADQP